MNKNDFINLMGGGIPVDRNMLKEINELVSVFPYFQTAHLLLLKGLKENSDVKFENQLKNSAIHIADREILYNLLQVSPDQLISDLGNVPEIPDTRIDIMIPESDVITNAEQFTVESLENQVEKVPDTGFIPENEAKDRPLPYEEGSGVEYIGETEKKGSEPEFPGEYQTTPEPPILTDTIDSEQTVIESAKNSEDLINEFEKGNIPDEDKKVSEEPSESTVVISQESDSGDTFSTLVVINKETGEVEEKIFYMDPGFSVDDPEFLSSPERAGIDQTGADFSGGSIAEPGQTPEILGETYERSEIPEKQKQADLIDKFILSNPRIEPRKEKSDLPLEDLSDQFTEEKGGFITETLARIYINQGYYSKAIEIYEKLSLKFPEKSGYFATQIERIKENYK
jgi:hypothetical protein